jgi:hypothetical protein
MKPLRRMLRADRLACALLFAGAAGLAAFYVISNARIVTNYSDLYYMLGFLRGFSDALYEGTLYPRWLAHLFGGAGEPVFVFYPPLAFWLSGLVVLPRSFDPLGICQLGIGMGLGTGATAIAAYIWLRRHAAPPVALAIALLLLFAPSRFLLMQEQVSLPQLWATAWFFPALFCLERWRETENRRALLGFSLWLALIALTHAPSLLLFAPVLALYGLLYRRPSWRLTGKLALACLLSAGLAACYLLPCALNSPFIRSDGYFDRFAHASSYAFFSPFILLAAAPYLAIALWALLRQARDKEVRSSALIAFALITLLTGALFLPVSKPLWEHLFPLRLLQAPFRFLSLLAALSPLLMLSLFRGRPVLFVFWALCMLQLPAAYMAFKEYAYYRDHTQSDALQREMREGLAMGVSAPEYQTRWMQAAKPTMEDLHAIDAADPAAIVTGEGALSLRTLQNGHLLLHVFAPKPVTLLIKQHYFPGWQARADGKPVALRPAFATGFMELDVPAHAQAVALDFHPHGARAGTLISCICLLAWLGFFGYKPRHDSD